MRLPFFYRILVGCLVVALIPLLISNVSNTSILYSRLQTQADQEAAQRLEEAGQQLSELLNTCQTVSQNISANNLFWTAMLRRSELLTTAHLALYQVGRDLPAEATLSLYDAGGRLLYTTNSTTAYASLPLRWGVLRKAREAAGIVYYDIENFGAKTSPYVMHTAQRLESPDHLLVGYTVISLTAEAFDVVSAGGHSGSNLVVSDGVGGVVYAQTQSTSAQELTLFRALMGQGGGFYDGQDNTFTVVRHPSSGYYLALRQPKPFTLDTQRNIRTVAATTAVVSVLLCMVFSLFASRWLIKPIRDLSLAMTQARVGNLEIQLDTSRQDELGVLTNSFNQMMTELRRYVYTTLRQQQEVTESRIKLLQAQLNPHFLYNTLDTVKWLAKINDIPEIASIAAGLAAILRQCVSAAQFVTLSKELAVVQSYVDIQRIRFSDRFSYLVDVPPQLAQCLIPKLILQPIVENAILHGLENKHDGFIYVYAVCTEDNILQISITDDGCGMSPDVAAQLGRVAPQSSSGHMGLFNVSHIISMHYGPQYGLNTHSIPDIGTTVSVRLPMVIQPEQAEEKLGKE